MIINGLTRDTNEECHRGSRRGARRGPHASGDASSLRQAGTPGTGRLGRVPSARQPAARRAVLAPVAERGRKHRGTDARRCRAHRCGPPGVKDGASRSPSAAQRECEARRDCDRYEHACRLLLLAGASAHEVSSPLNVIMLNIELASARTSQAAVRPLLDRARAEVARCTAASRRLLEFAPEPRHAPRALRPDQLAAEACALARGALEARGVSLIDDTQPLPPASLDAVAVRTALLVLMRDAGLRGEEGTTVRVHGERDADALRLCVEDDAPALPGALIGQAGNPFRAADPATAHQVLGIGVARHVAMRHGGALHVRGCDGPGTRAILELPTGPGSPAAAT